MTFLHIIGASCLFFAMVAQVIGLASHLYRANSDMRRAISPQQLAEAKVDRMNGVLGLVATVAGYTWLTAVLLVSIRAGVLT